MLDRSLFDKDVTDDDIYKKIFDAMYNDHNIFVSSIECDNDNGHIIVVGYSSTREEFDEYMKEHPELKIINRFKGKRREIVSDETGKFLSMGMSSAWRREQGKQMEKMMKDSIETVKKAIKKLAKINGTSKNLYIQVLDQSLFDDNMAVKKILEEMTEKIEKEYHTTQCTVCYDKGGDSVIVVGYTLPSSEKGELN